jgi:glycosyltransferase involved in cell wall biosynthesis
VRVSVIVCTYNRSESLRQALSNMEGLAIPEGVIWELLVIDNNSTDDTRETVEEFQRKSILPLQYILERCRGKSHALNSGIKAASGEILAFTDDDCIVDNGWLASVVSEFQSDPNLSLMGGRVELYNKSDRPVTIRTFRHRLSLGSPGQLFNFIAGCNLAVRRTVFEKVGRFDIHFGPGTAIVVDDVDFIFRTFKRGLKIIYSPDVLVYHNHGRRTDEQVRTLNRSYIIGRGGFYCKHILRGDRDVLKMAYWEIATLLKELCKKLTLGISIKQERACLGYLCRGGAFQLGNILGSSLVTRNLDKSSTCLRNSR